MILRFYRNYLQEILTYNLGEANLLQEKQRKIYKNKSLYITMSTEVKKIIDKLEHIQEDLDYIKERLADVDYVLMDDDIDALHEAQEEYKAGKTKRLA